MEKRSILDWIIAPKIRSISGVAEVNALGGEVKTYEVTPNLDAMRTLGVTLDDIFNALESNKKMVGLEELLKGFESILG